MPRTHLSAPLFPRAATKLPGAPELSGPERFGEMDLSWTLVIIIAGAQWEHSLTSLWQLFFMLPSTLGPGVTVAPMAASALLTS